MDKLLEQLCNSFGVSSRETALKNIIKNEIETIKTNNKVAIDINEDRLENLIVKIGEGSERLMICTHIDNPGFMVSLIENSGFIKVAPIGNIKPEKMVGMLVKFQNNIIGRIDSSKSNPLVEDLFIDIGVEGKEMAEKQVKEGDVGELVGNRLESNGRVIGPNLHNKVSPFALIQIIKEVCRLGKINKEIYFVFSTLHQMGFLGARAAAFEIKPDVAIVLEGLEVEDYTGGKGNIKLDSGPIINIFDKSLVIHHEIKECVDGASNKLNIKVQYSIGSGKNEGGLIHKEVGGVKTGTIGIPCRYMDTSEEMMSFKDINDTISLIYEVIVNINNRA